jgi:hypothetical protein
MPINRDLAGLNQVASDPRHGNSISGEVVLDDAATLDHGPVGVEAALASVEINDLELARIDQ